MGTPLMNIEHISKQDKNIITFVIGIPILFFLGFVVYTFFNSRDIAEVIKEDRLTLNFNGNVDSVYRAKQDHNVQFILLDNGYKCSLPAKWENMIKAGDSLSKKKNTLYLEVYRKNDSKLVLDYRDTFKNY
ncbi:MAG: hypothetical protein WC622_03080 [Pedobacter sp.]|jgi:hypothetical protein|uniref:hypothetical protein n=1 Tax=Pedobacter sp. TaxID=1411316 RepID=UPI00356A851D